MAREPRTLFYPPVWTFIVISLDPEATVRLYCNGVVDDIARAEIAEKTDGFKRYPGYSSQLGETLPFPDREFHRIHWRPVQKGLTRSPPTRSFEPYMCFPILPATEHPHGRMGMRTSRPLPWSDCYIPTAHDFEFRVTNAMVDFTDATEINGYDAGHLKRTGRVDLDRVHEVERAREEGIELPIHEIELEELEENIRVNVWQKSCWDQVGYHPDEEPGRKLDCSVPAPDSDQEPRLDEAKHSQHNERDTEEKETATAPDITAEQNQQVLGDPNEGRLSLAPEGDSEEKVATSQEPQNLGALNDSQLSLPPVDGDDPEDVEWETQSLPESLDEVASIFAEAFDANYADPAHDEVLTPLIRFSTDLQEIKEAGFPDWLDLLVELDILKGIVDRAKVRAKEHGEQFPDESAVQANEPDKEADSSPHSPPPSKRRFYSSLRPKIPLPKLPGPVVKAMDKVKKLYKGSLLDRGISKSKHWVRETAGRVARCGKEKDIAS